MNYTNGEKIEQASKKMKTKAMHAEARLNDAVSSVSENLTERAQQLADQFQQVSQQLRARASEAREKTSKTVSEHPFYSIGAAAAVGLAIGLLFGRRR